MRRNLDRRQKVEQNVSTKMTKLKISESDYGKKQLPLFIPVC